MSLYIELIQSLRADQSDYGRGLTYGRALVHFVYGGLEPYEFIAFENINCAISRGVKA